jgi:tetratricopeptide (TPR) repeat protein
VKRFQLCKLLGVVIVGLLYGHVPLRAQPISNDTNPAPTEPAPRVDEPATTNGNSARTADESDPSIDEPMASDESNKPWSQGVTNDERRTARQLFREGNRMFRLPLFAKAVELYTAALSKWKHPAFYFNLAIAQLNLGKEVEARENLQRALKYGDQGLAEEEFREAHKQLEALERQLGRIRVHSQTQGAEVSLDGVTLFIGPGHYEGWIKAKDHQLTAKKSGYLSEARRVTVSAGALKSVELNLITLSEATDASRRWSVWKPWAVVVAGTAIAITGGGLHALASRSFNAYDAQLQDLECATPFGDPPRVPGCAKESLLEEKGLNSKLKRAKWEQAFAMGSYVAGGSLIAAGIVLLYMNRPQLTEQENSNSSVRAISLFPNVTDSALSLLLSMPY